MKRKSFRSIVCLVALGLVLAACSPAQVLPTLLSAPTNTPIPANTSTTTPTLILPATPTSTAIPTDTPTSIPTKTLTFTPTAASALPHLSDPKPGAWKGELNGVTTVFEITKTGQFGVFVIMAPDKNSLGGASTCNLGVENTEKIEISEYSKFIANKSVDVTSLYKNLTTAEADFVKKNAPTPIATETSNGKLVDVYYVTGEFTSSTTVQGTFSVMECKGASTGQGYLRFAPITGTWKAEWVKDTP